MAKVRIIVDGTVRGTGYRALVKHCASRRGIKGLVRNLEDGKVEIFCDGSKDKIKQFMKDIEVKGDPSDPLSLNVEQVDSYWEGDKKFRDAWKSYSGFEIDYGTDELSRFQRENLESLEWAKLRFTRLENGIYSFRDSTNNNFEVMAKKYGNISKEVKITKKELKQSIEQKLPQKLAEALAKSMKKALHND
jgi:acylphosphatase